MAAGLVIADDADERVIGLLAGINKLALILASRDRACGLSRGM